MFHTFFLFCIYIEIFLFSLSVPPTLGGWPSEVANIPANDFCKKKNYYLLSFYKYSIIVLRMYPLLTDDCLYIFYICTDNVDGWPQNKNICTKLFEECEQKLPADKDQQVQGQLVDNPIEYFLHKIMI